MVAKRKWRDLTMNIVQPCWNLGLKCASFDEPEIMSNLKVYAKISATLDIKS
jgi:hypothetical protein